MLLRLLKRRKKLFVIYDKEKDNYYSGEYNGKSVFRSVCEAKSYKSPDKRYINELKSRLSNNPKLEFVEVWL